MEKQMVFK